MFPSEYYLNIMELNEYKTLAMVESHHWWLKFLHRKVLDLLLNEFKNKDRKLSILDIGCGTGGLMQFLSNYPTYFDLVGCEPNSWAAEFSKKRGLKVYNCSLNHLDTTKNKYDVILCMDVFYHKNIDPIHDISSIYDLIQTNGLLLFNVAAMPCLTRAHDIRVMGSRRFLKTELRDLILDTGLAIKSLYYWNSLLTPIILISILKERIINNFSVKQTSMSLPPKLINLALFLILRLESLILKFIKLPFGSSLFLEARKYH